MKYEVFFYFIYFIDFFLLFIEVWDCMVRIYFRMFKVKFNNLKVLGILLIVGMVGSVWFVVSRIILVLIIVLVLFGSVLFLWMFINCFILIKYMV